MIRSELDAAGIDDPRLREGYRRCRELNAAHGRTFFLATRLLAPDQRPAVHALYGFARYADDILDDLDPGLSADVRGMRLQQLADQFFSGGDHLDDPVLAAVTHTARRYRIGTELFDDFLASMRMDLTVTDYPDRGALNLYMRGSAEAIGLQVLPVLGTVAPVEETAPYAAALGRAFQLTNFLRDVDEDLLRQRVYLPADELAAHGVDRELLTWCHRKRRTDPRVREALAAQHEITRETYRFAAAGIGMLSPRSRPCVATAAALYSEILDRIEESDFAVFNHRATVGRARRLQVAGIGLIRSWRARSSSPGVADAPGAA
ncbi:MULTISPECIES: phytoene/squalene synthase family protein [unclassified Mycobacterium]|uniref:phytoene/squalene synthase family protein n=2 Tax=Mycobacterium TaxID=1763 RepID=UPI0007FE6544|nr:MULTISPECIES: phytoene/squalene synthase family protein [unclassified Mycobacterium]OBG56256.1 phytoene synthase [Mycobacterium sp. E735]OBG64360.1 phytoene synthase [Mycobacterium sp. E188]OBG79013.1 phytoene synthase [Mycobacterium sp. E3305]OBH36115.1 phytoene synthase [Mycobacterium sp. E183]